MKAHLPTLVRAYSEIIFQIRDTPSPRDFILSLIFTLSEGKYVPLAKKPPNEPVVTAAKILKARKVLMPNSSSNDRLSPFDHTTHC